MPVKSMDRVAFTSDDIGVMLLESITKGLYHDPLNSVREYVQNEYDAGASEIHITIAEDRLTIAGNSSGMSEEELLSARRIGFSTKDPREHVGFRGIGIWSGVAICDEVFVSTKKEGDPTGFVLKIDARGLRADIGHRHISLVEALSNRVWMSQITREEFREKRGTRVELRKLLSEHIAALAREKLLMYARQILPVSLDPEYEHTETIEEELRARDPAYRTVSIQVNDAQAFRPPMRAVSTLEPVFETLKDPDDRPLAVVWYAISEKGAIDPASRYLVYKKRGFTVGDTSRSNLMILKGSDIHAFAWATGEIHVLDEEVVPTSERIDFETNSAYLQLEGQARELLSTIVASVRRHQAGRSAEERMEYLRSIRPKFLAETDAEERLNVFLEGQSLVKLLNQDVKNPRISGPFKREIRKARAQLKTDLAYMGRNFEIPPRPLEETTGVRKRRKRKAAERPTTPTEEELSGLLGAYFPFDQLSLKLLAAVIRSVRKLVRQSDRRVDEFVSYLREELQTTTRYK